MRLPILAALILLPAAALAETATETPKRFTPAPVPAITPPNAQSGSPATVPEQVAPAAIAAPVAGPANATPFSGAPQGGASGVAPDLSR